MGTVDVRVEVDRRRGDALSIGRLHLHDSHGAMVSGSGELTRSADADWQLTFDGGPIDDPKLNARPVRKAGNVQAGVSVQGNVRESVLTLFSSPSMAVEDIGTIMLPLLTAKEVASTATATSSRSLNMMTRGRWSKDQLKLAFHLYCQLPFGRLHQRNPEIVELATLIGRTPSAVAMKLGNFASLDPAITQTGRTGLGNASAADRDIWEEFHADWEGLAVECARLRASLGAVAEEEVADEMSADAPAISEFTGDVREAMVRVRVKQSFFRRVVLSSYDYRCCMSGVREPKLLIASHIKPWASDAKNRLNPRNGLCLSALHDRAFDQGLITVTPELKIRVSSKLMPEAGNPVVSASLMQLDGCEISMPERFVPDSVFLQWHAANRFIP